MASGSFAKAGACCTPIIGPIISSYLKLQEIKKSNPQGLQNARLYSICGAVGSVLSIATTVALIALGVLTVVPGIIIATVYVVVACMHLYNANRFLHLYQRTLRTLTGSIVV